MFYKLIEKKRNEWLSSPDCTVKDVIRYIEQRGMMHDAKSGGTVLLIISGFGILLKMEDV